MGTQALTKVTERMPSVFDDFFKPWNEWQILFFEDVYRKFYWMKRK